MAAQTVRFMNGTSKSWTKALLANLFRGQSKFSVMPYDATNGVTWADLSFSGADEIFTIKDSFSLTKADDTEEKVQIDQNGGETIDNYISERGEMTFEGNIPVLDPAYCNIFYSKGATVTGTAPVLGQQGTAYTAQAYALECKDDIYVTMLVENEAESKAIAFARVKLNVAPVFESGAPAYLKIKGTVLANTESTGTQLDWAVCDKYTTT